MSYRNLPPETDGNEYFEIYGRVTDSSVQMFIAVYETGDENYDEFIDKLSLLKASNNLTPDSLSEAEALAEREGRKLHPSYPSEIRYMCFGEVCVPCSYFLNKSCEIPEEVLCKACQSSKSNTDWYDFDCWYSVNNRTPPFFCSKKCFNKWYEFREYLN